MDHIRLEQASTQAEAEAEQLGAHRCHQMGPSFGGLPHAGRMDRPGVIRRLAFRRRRLDRGPSAQTLVGVAARSPVNGKMLTDC